VGEGQCVGAVPASAVENENGMGTGGDGSGDLGEVGVDRLGIDNGQDQACGEAPSGADRAKDVVSLVAGVAGPSGVPCPDAGEGALLADPRLMLRPYLDRFAPGLVGVALNRDHPIKCYTQHSKASGVLCCP
jgi:hypothetical protein